MTSARRRNTFRSNDRLRRAAANSTSTRIGSEPPTTRYRDRHGRGARSPILHPAVPGWATRREQFVELVHQVLREFQERVPEVAEIEFGVEEVPPSAPADWESHELTMARAFPRDRTRGLPGRIVLYRLPILQRNPGDLLDLAVYSLMAERICELTGADPDDLLG